MVEEPKTNEKATNKGQKKHRSPNYPYLGLKEALTKAELLRQTGGVHAVGLNSAMSAWGLKGEGTTSSVIAALKAFGLITVSGEGKHRQMTVSELGRKILIDHTEKAELLKKAALSPTLYAELWRKFGPELPPTDKPISEYLIFERSFNEKVVDALIADFKATIVFAGLSASDTVEEDGGDADGDENTKPPKNKGGSTNSQGQIKPPIKPAALGKGIMFNITIDVLENGQINVTNGGSLTAETFAILSDVFKLKEKYGKDPASSTVEGEIYDPTTGEEPGRMN